MQMDAQTLKTVMRARTARTGAPAEARIAFNPMARRNVLLPAMFEPLIT